MRAGDATLVLNSAGGFGFMAYGYYAKGLGNTILFYDAVDQFGNERDSYGGTAQLSYTIGDTRIGAIGGLSLLDETDEEADLFGDENLNVNQQIRLTGGVYHALTPNLQLVFEASYFSAESHAGGTIDNIGLNAGAFLSF
jgi:hypothetical protein